MPTSQARGRTAAAALAALLAALLSATVAVAPAGAASAGPNDPLFPQQWNLAQVQAPAAWTVSTGQGVPIGLVDTGVDLHHQDLAGKVVAAANCIGAGGDPARCNTASGAAQDDNGHGTHVAGIAAADTNNHLGVAGMAPGAQLVVAKSLDSTGSGTFADVDAGIEWVVDHGARVVNLSLGDSGSTPLLDGLLGGSGASLTTGIDYAWAHGAVPVVAAGNTNLFGLGSTNYGSIPAIVVGASGRDGQVAPYSSPTGNAQWAVLAPGGNGQVNGQPDCSTPDDQVDCIISTYWFPGQANQYAYDEGTSMAVAEVSGTLALLLAMGKSPQQAVSAVLSSADHSVSCGPGSPTCAGLLDAAAAVGAAPGSSTSGGGTSTSPAGSVSSAPGTGSGGRTTTTAAPTQTTMRPATAGRAPTGSLSGTSRRARSHPTTTTTAHPTTTTTLRKAVSPSVSGTAVPLAGYGSFKPSGNALAHPFVEAAPATGHPARGPAVVLALALLVVALLGAGGLVLARRRLWA